MYMFAAFAMKASECGHSYGDLIGGIVLRICSTPVGPQTGGVH